MIRAQEFLEAQRLQRVAVQLVDVERDSLGQGLVSAHRVDHTRLELARVYADLALVSATLASAGPGVEAEVVDLQRTTARVEATQRIAKATRPVLVGSDAAVRVAEAVEELEQQLVHGPQAAVFDGRPKPGPPPPRPPRPSISIVHTTTSPQENR